MIYSCKFGEISHVGLRDNVAFVGTRSVTLTGSALKSVCTSHLRCMCVCVCVWVWVGGCGWNIKNSEIAGSALYF